MQCVTAFGTASCAARLMRLLLLCGSADLLVIGWTFVGKSDCLVDPGLHEAQLPVMQLRILPGCIV